MNASEFNPDVPASCAASSGSETRWQVLNGRFHWSEASKRGWNIAWLGDSRDEAERVIEVRAETPEAARTLALEIARLLNGGRVKTVSPKVADAGGRSTVQVRTQPPSQCPACGCQVFDPFGWGRVIHDVEKCRGAKRHNDPSSATRPDGAGGAQKEL